MSPSAVSHQLSDLKRTLGEDLFAKSGRTLKLTNAGQMLAQRLSTAFNLLDTSIAKVTGEDRPVVRIAACSAFGPFWLAPQLGVFRDLHPEIDVELRLYGQDPELTNASADCIVTAQKVTPGYASIDLFHERAIMVASPLVAANEQLANLPLITTNTDDDDLGADWHEFVGQTGAFAQVPNTSGWLRCSHYILALETAKAGLGVALIPDFVAAAAIEDGHLIRIGEASFNNEGRVYRLCFKDARKNDREIQAVVGWLRRAVRHDQPNGAPKGRCGLDRKPELGSAGDN